MRFRSGDDPSAAAMVQLLTTVTNVITAGAQHVTIFLPSRPI